MRGLVATELAASGNRDDFRVVVRRATLTLDSDLALDADLLVKAARGAVCLADLPLADRLADAAIRAGGGGGELYSGTRTIVAQPGEEAEAVLAGLPTAGPPRKTRPDGLSCGPATYFGCSGDPVGAKETIDDAWGIAPSPARGYVEAFITVYWVGWTTGCGDASGEEPRSERPARCRRR